jgi:hypothetical protein
MFPVSVMLHTVICNAMNGCFPHPKGKLSEWRGFDSMRCLKHSEDDRLLQPTRPTRIFDQLLLYLVAAQLADAARPLLPHTKERKKHNDADNATNIV